MMKFPRPSPSIFAYCKRSKTGGVEGLGTRLDTGKVVVCWDTGKVVVCGDTGKVVVCGDTGKVVVCGDTGKVEVYKWYVVVVCGRTNEGEPGTMNLMSLVDTHYM